MAREWRAGHIAHRLFALLCMLMIALAVGAAWLVLGLYVPGARAWLALPAGAAIGYAMRAWIASSRNGAMALAALGTLLAAVYMQCLYVALNVAAVMGTGLTETLRRAGLGMLLSLARLSTDASMLLACLCGMAVALWVARQRRTRPSNAR